MSGPKGVTELPVDPADWKEELHVDKVYLHRGQLWEWLRAGCLLCIESSLPRSQTMKLHEHDVFMCLNHGELEKVPYRVGRVYTITLGHKTLEGSSTTDDFMLLPISQSKEEREATIETVLREAGEYEQTHDPFDDSGSTP